MAIVVNDDTPEFLRQFLISQGVIEVKDTETGQTKVVPLPPRRNPAAEQDDGGIDDEYIGYQVASAASGSSPGLFSNLFSSDTPMSAEDIATNQALAEAAERDAMETTRGWNMDVDMNAGYQNPTVSLTTSPQDLASLKPSNPLDQFTNFVSKTTNEISTGLFGDVNLLGQDRTGKSFTDRLGLGQVLSNPFSSFKEVFTDPYISDSRKAAYGLGKGVQSVVGSLTGLGLPLGLFSKMAHAAGAHHPFDLSQDSNIFADPISGTMTWDSLSPGAGGFQQGVLNMDNAIADIANQNPNQFINTPMGYITAENLNDAIKSGYFSPDQISAGDLSDVGFVEGTPFSQESFVSGNVTNQEALNQFYSGMGGAILNEAADQLGPNAGYNETRDLANAIAEGIEYGPYDMGGGDGFGDMADDYGFTSEDMDPGSEF